MDCEMSGSFSFENYYSQSILKSSLLGKKYPAEVYLCISGFERKPQDVIYLESGKCNTTS